MNAVPNSFGRWHQAMIGLLYPAVLGAIVYAVGNSLWEQGLGSLSDRLLTQGSAQPLVGVALVALFTFDYVYTMNDGHNYKGYQFALDSLAISSLFLAGKAVVESLPEVTLLAWYLLAARSLGLLYEIARLPKDRKARAVAAVTCPVSSIQ